MPQFPSISYLKTAESFQSRLTELGLDLPFDEQVDAHGALAQSIVWKQGTIGNRFCILPMEGWDGTRDGKPTELTQRRWRNFGLSGAKLIWGGEAVAVRHDGRANPNQLVMNDGNLKDIADLRELLLNTHIEHFGQTNDLLVGLQLTHSGRFARPNEKKVAEPRVLYRHPVLDPRVGITDDSKVFTDEELARLVDDFIRAARQAEDAGYAFVDIKHCHGYLGHEFLSSFDRPGAYGGSFENRTKFLRDIVSGIRANTRHLSMGVRVSIFDFVPFMPGPDRVGQPAASGPYGCAFSGDGSGIGYELRESHRFFDLLESLGIELVCSTAGSPYYNPHMQRPAAFPPSDGYLPPEDPLVGVARQIQTTAEMKRRHPNLIVVGSAYSYLQEWLPHVGQAVVRLGMADSIGLGRMVLSYPNLPADVLAGRAMQRKLICRTFSECTTAPRNGIVSGCFPLDPFYKARPERAELYRIMGKTSGSSQSDDA